MFTLFKKFLKYGVAGGSAFIFDFALIYILIEYVEIHYLIAVPIAFIVGTMINYGINHLWVFKGTQQNVKTGYVLFLIVAIVGVLLTMGFMYMMIEWWNVQTLWARVIAAGLVYIWSFSANFIFTFKEKQNVIK